MTSARIPSPSVSAFHLGPLTVHIYALCILAGIAIALWWASRRWVARGGEADDLFDIGFVAVVAGIVGARLYHVVTSPEAYFGPGGNPVAVLYVWNGGLGIWGGVAGGALGAWLMARRRRVPFTVVADTMAPTLLVAQAVGRLGNWFNQELFGRPTEVPWGLHITCRTGGAWIADCTPGTYHPTFLYELLWNLAACAVLLLVERRFRLGGGRVFWGYVALYTAGRFWIELMRSDAAERILGQRVNVWVAAGMFLLAVIMLAVLTRRRRIRGTEATRADRLGPFRETAETPFSPAGSHMVDGTGSIDGRRR